LLFSFAFLFLHFLSVWRISMGVGFLNLSNRLRSKLCFQLLRSCSYFEFRSMVCLKVTTYYCIAGRRLRQGCVSVSL
jgi:hypothetical protein